MKRLGLVAALGIRSSLVAMLAIRMGLVAALLGAGIAAAEAHDVRPAYLELRTAGDPERIEVLFKVPVLRAGMRPFLSLAWPDGARAREEDAGGLVGDAWVQRFHVERRGGFTGAAFGVRGMENGLSDVLVRYEAAGGVTQIARLSGDSPTFTIAPSPRRFEVAATYTRLGIDHILLGIDHLLFVLALVLLTDGVWRLVRTITAFTIAHSITLALATLGVVRVPQAPVEATIALSIVFVAAEIARRREAGTPLRGVDPWIVAFTFGLLHGFGFAGALHEIGLPQGAIPLALLFFNVGVEAGQLLFIAAVLGLAAVLKRLPLRPPAWTWRLLPYGIGGVAAFWLMERLSTL